MLVWYIPYFSASDLVDEWNVSLLHIGVQGLHGTITSGNLRSDIQEMQTKEYFLI